MTSNLNNKTRAELEDYIQRIQNQKENIEKNLLMAKEILETKRDWIDTEGSFGVICQNREEAAYMIEWCKAKGWLPPTDKSDILRSLLFEIVQLNVTNCSGIRWDMMTYDLNPLCYSYRLAQLALKISENDDEDDFFQGWEIGKIIEEIKSLKMEMDRRGVKIQ